MVTVTPERPNRSTAVAEALGYVGGALVLVGVVLVVARTWESLGVGGRLAVAVVVAAAVGLGAWRVPATDDRSGALARLQSTLWVVCALALALAGGLAVHDLLDARSPQAVVLGGAVVAGAVGALVWRGRPRVAEQALTLIAGAVAAGAPGAHIHDPGLTGVFAAIVGLGVITVGLTKCTSPSWVAVWCGAMTLLVSCQMIAAQWPGPGLVVSVLVATALVALAQLLHPVTDPHHVTACAVIGSVLLFGTLPTAIGHHADQAAVATGLTVWAAGVLLLVAASGAVPMRAPIPALVLSAVLFSVGPAVMASDHRTVGVVFGLVAASVVVTVAVGAGQVRPTLVGSSGLIVFVPWIIVELVPGELGAPLAIVVTGLMVVAVALWLMRRRRVTPTDCAASRPSSRAPEGVA
jgi:hypothetical protein